ncbi:MAG: cell division protein FtsQ [Rhodobacteraceae bacterium]|nr:cell division protein FtsQ [Paracoccaceae bacterium]
MHALVATRETVTAPVVIAPHRDPAPSKMRYRLQRLWLRKYVRPIVMIWLPILVVGLLVLMVSRNDSFRGFIQQKYDNVRGAIAARPELMIETVRIPVGSVDLVHQIDGVMDLTLPVSALDVDLEGLRQIVQGLSAVKTATVQLDGNGLLEITIVERIPEMVWRTGNRIFLLDETGIRVAEVPRRAVRVDLPLIIGEGADLAIPEARALFKMASPLEERIRALVRVGERRWNIVLDGDQTIMLPEFGAEDALRLVVEMQTTEQIMNWNLSVVDMRDPNRPIIRLNNDALDELTRLRAAALGEPV